MPLRILINEDGTPFELSELKAICEDLETLDNAGKIAYRNTNAEIIAKHRAEKMLIVSGPGTGKSTIFKHRIAHWLSSDSTAGILALSFVRKLVADLDNDIQNDKSLSDEQKKQTQVYTLHKYARSVVEKNKGSRAQPLGAHIRIIGESWKNIVWEDTLLCVGESDNSTYSWKNFEKQLHDNNFEASVGWHQLKEKYFTLCSFYNAVGFSDLIIRASEALKENPGLIEQEFFIIDEYQDFNQAEEELIETISNSAKGLLIVGDDDQVLYEELKSGKASLIRELYNDKGFVNAMLPYCGRCDYHIVKATEYFIQKDREQESIEKVYLPLNGDTASPKVQVIGCATSATAVDYIRKFVEVHEKEIEERKAKLENNEEKDPFLLILSPSRELKFYSSKSAKEQLFGIVNKYKREDKKFSEDYFMVLNYYSLAKHPENNFTFRKVLFYEGVFVNKFLPHCLDKNIGFYQISDELIKSIMVKTSEIQEIIDSKDPVTDKVAKLNKHLKIEDPDKLISEMGTKEMSDKAITFLEHEEEEEAELAELEIQEMSSVEFMTIVGAKGLSADHVIIIGFDETNMAWITKNAFFVAMTRARKSLHIITALASGGSKGPHYFLNSIPEEHIDFNSYRKKDGLIKILQNKKEFLKYIKSLTSFRKK